MTPEAKRIVDELDGEFSSRLAAAVKVAGNGAVYI